MPFEQPRDVGDRIVFCGDGKSVLTTHVYGTANAGEACLWDAATARLAKLAAGPPKARDRP